VIIHWEPFVVREGGFPVFASPGASVWVWEGQPGSRWAQGLQKTARSEQEVRTALFEERELATTTIKTMLRRMDADGIVGHRADGRTFIYKPVVAEPDIRKAAVLDMVQRLFKGDGPALVNHLIESGDIDASELDELRARLAET